MITVSTLYLFDVRLVLIQLRAPADSSRLSVFISDDSGLFGISRFIGYRSPDEPTG